MIYLAHVVFAVCSFLRYSFFFEVQSRETILKDGLDNLLGDSFIHLHSGDIFIDVKKYAKKIRICKTVATGDLLCYKCIFSYVSPSPHARKVESIFGGIKSGLFLFNML